MLSYLSGTFGGGAGENPYAKPAYARTSAPVTKGYGSAGTTSTGMLNNPQMPYQPEVPQARSTLDTLANTGTQMLNPASNYSKQLREELLTQGGQQGRAQQRAAQLYAIRGGMGGGATPQLAELQASAGRAGVESGAESAAAAALESPRLGTNMLSTALSGELGLSGQKLSGWLAQQNLNAQQERDQLNADLERDRLANDTRLRELALNYGGLF